MGIINDFFGVAGEIADTKEKRYSESNAVGDAERKRVSVSEEEKIFAKPIPGILFDPADQEKETQAFADADSVARRIGASVSGPQRNAQGQRDAISFSEKERRAGHDLGQ